MKKLLFNPFEKFSEAKLLLFGIAITLIGSYLGFLFNGRFDGVIDLHFTEEFAIYKPFIDNAINIFSISIFLFIFGKIINKKTRFIDILIPALVSRLPFYFLPFANINNYLSDLSNAILNTLDLKNPTAFNLEIADLAVLLSFTFISILFLVWFVMLLFNGFKVATNCKTINHTLLFVAGIILAEILSKILMSFLNY